LLRVFCANDVTPVELSVRPATTAIKSDFLRHDASSGCRVFC